LSTSGYNSRGLASGGDVAGTGKVQQKSGVVAALQTTNVNGNLAYASGTGEGSPVKDEYLRGGFTSYSKTSVIEIRLDSRLSYY
jgi:hypothetical protein